MQSKLRKLILTFLEIAEIEGWNRGQFEAWCEKNKLDPDTLIDKSKSDWFAVIAADHIRKTMRQDAKAKQNEQ